MSMEPDRELERDPYLAACLRAAEGEIPVDEVDWNALRASVVERAELPLRRLRKRSRPRRWAGPVVSLAAAAGIAAVALLGGLDRKPAAAPTDATSVAIEEVMRSDLTDQEFGIVASGRENTVALLQIAANTD